MVFEAIDCHERHFKIFLRACVRHVGGCSAAFSLKRVSVGRHFRSPCRQHKDLTMPVRPDRYCPMARTLDVVGERWTLLILRDLVLDGPRKFQDLEQSLSGISPNTLSARLKTLEENGIVERRFYTDHPPRAEYLITSKGLDFAPSSERSRRGAKNIPVRDCLSAAIRAHDRARNLTGRYRHFVANWIEPGIIAMTGLISSLKR